MNQPDHAAQPTATANLATSGRLQNGTALASSPSPPASVSAAHCKRYRRQYERRSTPIFRAAPPRANGRVSSTPSASSSELALESDSGVVVSLFSSDTDCAEGPEVAQNGTGGVAGLHSARGREGGGRGDTPTGGRNADARGVANVHDHGDLIPYAMKWVKRNRALLGRLSTFLSQVTTLEGAAWFVVHSAPSWTYPRVISCKHGCGDWVPQ